MTPKLILASSSPFRRMLMENAGITFEAHPAEIDERAIEAPLEQDGATPDAIAMVLAKAKARDVSGRFAGALVIGSDQTMSLGDRAFHKPKSMGEAADHLIALSAKTHRLNSAIAIAYNGDIIWEHMSRAELTMRELTTDFAEQRRGLSARRGGVATVLENRWGLLHHIGVANAAASRKATGIGGDRWMIHVKHCRRRLSSAASR
jgi:septum formation protein